MKKIFFEISGWLKERPWKSFLIFISLSIFILFLPKWLTEESYYPILINKWTAQMGDTFGVIMGPFVALLAAFITFMAFWVQFKANQQIRNDTKIERFENKFYEMLRIHIDNVNSIEIANKHKGRKAFVKMFEELRFIYSVLKKIDKKYKLVDQIKDKEKKKHEKYIKIAYHHMFFGIDYESKQCNNEMGNQYFKVSEILSSKLTRYQKKFLKCKKRIVEKYTYNHNGKHTKTFEPDYYPFDGHVSKLGHLYRHLYHMIKFVVRTDWLEWRQKYGYLKMLRGQLSNHEQAIMFFNIIWIEEDKWWKDSKSKGEQSYLLDYAILKNLPFNLTEQLGPDPKSYFLKKIEEVKRFKGYSKSEKEFGEFDDDQKLQWLFEWNN
ncbi:putative phage abortive infection protein [Marivirga sp.]|uniref:putative phage abortive infection protein n=1 Tax=Marivirga sp. TaxID=2018662 RepID=UPI003DA79F56